MAANVVSGSIQVPGLTARKRDLFRRGGSLGVDALARALVRPQMSAPSAVAAQEISSERRCIISSAGLAASCGRRCHRWLGHMRALDEALIPEHCQKHW